MKKNRKKIHWWTLVLVFVVFMLTSFGYSLIKELAESRSAQWIICGIIVFIIIVFLNSFRAKAKE
ncbi:MAG: hypothetical protein Q8O66_01680 [bacterium]|nr:hypothetical protein [bacterium]